MTPPHRAKLVLLVLAVAIVGLGVWAWMDEGPLWRWTMRKRSYVAVQSYDGMELREFRTG